MQRDCKGILADNIASSTETRKRANVTTARFDDTIFCLDINVVSGAMGRVLAAIFLPSTFLYECSLPSTTTANKLFDGTVCEFP